MLRGDKQPSKMRDLTNHKASLSAASTPVSKLMRGMGELAIAKTPGSGVRSTRAAIPGGASAAVATKAPGNGVAAALRRRDITPSRNHNYSSSYCGDRYMAVRDQSQFELASFLLTQQIEEKLNTSRSAPTSPTKEIADRQKQEMLKLLRASSMTSLSAMQSGNNTTEEGEQSERILVYRKNCAPAPPVGHLNQAKVLYSATASAATSSVKKKARYIPAQPDRILDAPGLQEDFYLNVLDWGKHGVLAVALETSIYLWTPATGDTICLVQSTGVHDSTLIGAVKWSNDGKFLAAGFHDGTVRIYDPSRMDRGENALLRTLQPADPTQTGRIAALDWNGRVLSVGQLWGDIVHHDVSKSQSRIGTYVGHTKEVCGLTWSAEKHLLCSGSADFHARLWDARFTAPNAGSLFTLDEHMGPVKAVSFCSYKSQQVATGGGSTDRTVKLWDVNNGQVTGIVFNSSYREMLTSHGRPDNVLKIWRHPNYSLVHTLKGHTDMVVSCCISPDDEYVLSAGDESLRIWHCFKVDKTTERLQKARGALDPLNFR